MAGMLDGVLVVSLEQAVAAPLVTARMADAGARVIKVEREQGDFARGYDDSAKGESAMFVWLNRGKESLVLDFKQAADAALLSRILARTDVFVQNLAPGAAERAGLGAAELRRRNPRLITCDVSGYGTEGPYREMKAYDLLVQAESGLASITGTPEAPGRIGTSVVDIGTGLNALAGILMALYHRERTGEGAALTVSMFDCMADWMAYHLIFWEYAEKLLPRTGLTHPLVCPYGTFAVKGGAQLLISIQNDREWERFAAQVLERPELAAREGFQNNIARVENRAEVEREIQAVLSGLERDETEARLRKAQIAYGAVNSVPELSVHGALRRVEVDTPSGRIGMPAPPLRLGGETARLGPVPALGEHNAAIRAEFAQ
jgi:crotonobetainyl-CoA:carnitine CoA-transferase CaiB-like acyl-CoA transferase